jgi:hypothetical protein
MKGHMHGEGRTGLHVHAKVSVTGVVSSRYGRFSAGKRPLRWDDRVEGREVVKVEGGQELTLLSSAMQSTPKPGWILVLTGGSEREGYTWTLYGIAPRH